MECIEWLEDLLNRLWIPSDPHTHPPYRGMPLVILALDRNRLHSLSHKHINVPVHTVIHIVYIHISLPAHIYLLLLYFAHTHTHTHTKHTNTGEGSNSPLHYCARALAASVQAICLTERPTDQPKRPCGFVGDRAATQCSDRRCVATGSILHL